MSSSESNAITGRPTRTIIPVRRLINEPIASQPRRRRGGAVARAPRSGGGVIRGPQARATRSRAVMVRFLLSFITTMTSLSSLSSLFLSRQLNLLLLQLPSTM